MGRELTPNRIAPFTSKGCPSVVLCGISTCFQVLSPCPGQIAHALLTRPPLEHEPSGRSLPFHVLARLACVKHAASVRPEPGSNSDVQSLSSTSMSTHDQLAKASRFLHFVKAFHSFESDCHRRVFAPFSALRRRFLYKMTFSVSFSRIAHCRPLRCFAPSLAATSRIIAPPTFTVNPFFAVFPFHNLTPQIRLISTVFPEYSNFSFF